MPTTAVPVVSATADRAAPCPVYRWCVATGDHWDHCGADLCVPSPGKGEPDYLTAHLLHLSGSRPIIGLEHACLDAVQARAEAAKLRAFAGQLETLATVLDATCITVDGVL